MQDQMEKKGIQVDVEKLSKQLLTPVVIIEYENRD